MGSTRCHACEGDVDVRHRFCPWCAAPLRAKLVELFTPHPAIEGDHDRLLRVSRYLGPDAGERQTRFSVWSPDGRAQAAIGLDDAETDRLLRFLALGDAAPWAERHARGDTSPAHPA